MEDVGFDQEILELLEATYQSAMLIGGRVYAPEQIKLMIVATNLNSLAKTFLLADERPEEISLNLKQIALGLMGTSDFCRSDLDIELQEML